MTYTVKSTKGINEKGEKYFLFQILLKEVSLFKTSGQINNGEKIEIIEKFTGKQGIGWEKDIITFGELKLKTCNIGNITIGYNNPINDVIELQKIARVFLHELSLIQYEEIITKEIEI